MRRALLGPLSTLLLLALVAGCGSSADSSAAPAGFGEASDASADRAAPAPAQEACRAAYAKSQREQLKQGRSLDADSSEPRACRGLSEDTKTDLRLEAGRQNMATARTWKWTRARQNASAGRPASTTAATGTKTAPYAESTTACRAAIRRQIEGDIRVDRSKPAPCRHLDRPTYERLFADTFAEYRDGDLATFGFADR